MSHRISVRVALAVALFGAPRRRRPQTEIQWWHSMTGALGDRVNDIANGFNASQKDYKVVPVYKGSYPESMTAAIAAFRAGNAPHILQVFEVGTATMMAAKGAIKPVYADDEGGEGAFDPKNYLPAVAGYYSDSKGNMLSMPFNSSTPVFYVNKDAFKKAGLDPEKAPKTWDEFAVAAAKLKASGAGVRLHDRLAVLGAHRELQRLAQPADRHQVERHRRPRHRVQDQLAATTSRTSSMLADYAKKGWFTYSGRTNQGEARFFSGECAMLTSSSAAQANIRKNAKFDFSVNFLPYYARRSRARRRTRSSAAPRCG